MCGICVFDFLSPFPYEAEQGVNNLLSAHMTSVGKVILKVCIQYCVA